MWLWGLEDIDDSSSFEYGIDIDSFFRRIASENSVTYFHNLKFDGTFILDWLLKHGFTRNDSSHRLRYGEFSTLISDQGKFYSIKVKWRNGTTTEFRDSFKKLPMSVENVARAFKMEEGKGDLDYSAPRPVGHKPTRDELDYLRRDVGIVAKALKVTIDEGMTRLTVASDSMAEYKRLIGSKTFDRLFPVLPETMDSEIRRAYRGGFTYADPRFWKKRTCSGIVLDINSLYSHVMYSTVLPYGEPEWVDGKVEPTETHPLTVASITFTAKIKKGHIPCIQIKGSSMFVGTEYLREVKEPTNMMVTNVDLELWNRHYDLVIHSHEGGWRFKGVRGMFDTYIDKWSEIKAKATGGLREIAKLHLNSLYGRFGSNPNVTGKIPYLKNDAVAFHQGPEEIRPPVYTAIAVFVTAYARTLTIDAAQANYKTFAYADTDSLHLLQDTVPDGIEVHETKRGAWALEYAFTEALYIRPKAYLEKLVDGTFVNRIAGLPERVSKNLTFDHVFDGAVFHGKLAPKNVPGGVVLEDVTFELKL